MPSVQLSPLLPPPRRHRGLAKGWQARRPQWARGGSHGEHRSDTASREGLGPATTVFKTVALLKKGWRHENAKVRVRSGHFAGPAFRKTNHWVITVEGQPISLAKPKTCKKSVGEPKPINRPSVTSRVVAREALQARYVPLVSSVDTSVVTGCDGMVAPPSLFGGTSACRWTMRHCPSSRR